MAYWLTRMPLIKVVPLLQRRSILCYLQQSIVYRIHLNWYGFGVRSHWMDIKDESNTQTLWAVQAVWSDEVPITTALLRRAGEFVPGIRAIKVDIQRTKGGSFELNMESLVTGEVTETPDRGEYTKDWSPRRFEYGGRYFVWKDENARSSFKKKHWEKLYETKRTWPREGSQTGKKEDETEGRKMFWGETTGGMHADHTLYLAAGMDQAIREHLLAIQCARHFRQNYPPHKDVKGVKAAGVAQSLLELST